LALSHARIAANVELPIGFSLTDDTVTAIVAQLSASGVDQAVLPAQVPNGPLNFEKVGLPDGSPGLFDPGWDVSIGVRSTNGGKDIHKYLVGHGLGSPFIEDAKLCAALGAYWPGLAPDATRQYPPEKWLDGLSYPWPSIAPLTDEELGMMPTATGKRMSWDGVPGPQRRTEGNRDVIAYHKMEHVDYIDILGTMTAALTARTEPDEYKTRILAMAAVYWSLVSKTEICCSPITTPRLCERSLNGPYCPSNWSQQTMQSFEPHLPLRSINSMDLTSTVSRSFDGEGKVRILPIQKSHWSKF
jgi:hypothetical protein